MIVGGGVAALEAMIALRSLAGDRLELTLISPEREFAYRPLAVLAAFGGPVGPSLAIDELARTVGASCITDSVVSVDATENRVALSGGSHVGYDFLLLAPGARAEESIPGAVTFGAPRGTQRFRRILAEAESGHISQLVFAVPADSGWPLAIYELAMLTAERLRAADVEITLLTPELAPLALFGGRASGAVLEDLEARGIHFVAGVYAEELAWGELRAHPGRIRVLADAVITLPRLRGAGISGVPCDDGGFIPIDRHGLVRGMADVYAAGDAVAFPIKQGGLAAQQACAAAESIAARVGAAVTPIPFAPVLKGMLLTGQEPRYLEATVADEGAQQGVASTSPLWWPPAKLAGRYLAPYLSGQVTATPIPPRGVSVTLALDSATELAAAGH